MDWPGPHGRCRRAGPALASDLPRIAEFAVCQSPTWRWPGVRRPRGPAQRPARPAWAPSYWLPVLESGRSAPGGLRWTDQHQVGQFGDRSGRSAPIEPAHVAAVARRPGGSHVQAQPVAQQPQGLDLDRQQRLARRVRPGRRPPACGPGRRDPRGCSIQSGSTVARCHVPRAPRARAEPHRSIDESQPPPAGGSAQRSARRSAPASAAASPRPSDPPAASTAGFAPVAPIGHLPGGHSPGLALRARRRGRANRGCVWRGRRRALATLNHALRCLGQPTPTSWNHDAPPSARSWAAKARRDPAPAGREPPFGGLPAGGSIRRQRNLTLQATSRRSDVLQPTTTTSSQRVVALTLVTRSTSRRPVASIPAAGPRRLLAARGMRHPQHAVSGRECLSRFP